MALATNLPPRLPQSDGSGGTFWVDPVNGNDTTGTGAAGAPWKTINKAVNSVNNPGAIIKVKNGSFASSATNYAINIVGRKIAGAQTNPITIQAENEYGVTITGPALGASNRTLGANIRNSWGYRIKGFKFSKILGTDGVGGSDSIGFEAAQSIEFDRCIFEDLGGLVAYARGNINELGPCADIWMYRCRFHPTGTTAFTRSGSGADLPNGALDWTCGMDCFGGYLDTKGTHFFYLGQYRGDQGPTSMSGVNRFVIANCVFVGKTPGRHVQMGPQARGVYVVNNTFYGNRIGTYKTSGTDDARYAGGACEFFLDTATGPNNSTRNCIVANNIMMNLSGHAAYGSAGGPILGCQVFKNLAWDVQNGNGFQDDVNDDFEETYGGTITLFTEPGGQITKADPKFVAPARTATADFHLQTGSPAIGVADPTYCPLDDYDGNPRSTTAPSIGALEGTGSGGGGGGSSPITFSQTTGGGAAALANTTVVGPLGTNVAINDVIVVAASRDGSSGNYDADTVSDNLGNTYNKVNTGFLDSGHGQTGIVFVCKVTVAGACTITVAHGGVNHSDRHVEVAVYKGVNTTTQVDASAWPASPTNAALTSSAGSADNAATPQITTVADQDMVVSIFIGTTGANALSAGTGSTQRALGNNSGNPPRILIQDRVQTPAGNVTPTATLANGAGTNYLAVALALKPAAAGSAPGNSTAPVVTGSPITTQNVTCDTGVWTNTPTSFTYQWQHDNAGDNNFVNIAGATTNTYTIPKADTNNKLRCVVTATNASGSTAANSNSVGPVTDAPQNNSRPSIVSANPLVGDTLLVDQGAWTGTPNPVLTNQWQRDTGGDLNFVDIPGQTALTYTLVTADLLCNIRCNVVGTNSAGSATVSSNRIGPVQQGAPSPVLSDEIILTETRRTTNTLYLSWDPVEGAAGYAFFVDGKRVSITGDPNRTTVKFGLDGNNHTFGVKALGILADGAFSV